MITALIFAGGIGERMNSRAKPKQFLEIHGKPILIYTIEHFELHPDIDNIVVVCLKDWIRELKVMLKRYMITKVKWIVPGGDTGHESIYNGLKVLAETVNDDDIVIIHDGVRPLITEELITENIKLTQEKGNAITVFMARESIADLTDSGTETNTINEIPDRDKMCIIKAPQTFYFKDIWAVHQKAIADNYKSIDAACMMHRYGYELHTVNCSSYNLKITSPSDYYIFRAIHDAQENLQIFGLN